MQHFINSIRINYFPNMEQSFFYKIFQQLLFLLLCFCLYYAFGTWPIIILILAGLTYLCEFLYRKTKDARNRRINAAEKQIQDKQLNSIFLHKNQRQNPKLNSSKFGLLKCDFDIKQQFKDRNQTLNHRNQSSNRRHQSSNRRDQSSNRRDQCSNTRQYQKANQYSHANQYQRNIEFQNRNQYTNQHDYSKVHDYSKAHDYQGRNGYLSSNNYKNVKQYQHFDRYQGQNKFRGQNNIRKQQNPEVIMQYQIQQMNIIEWIKPSLSYKEYWRVLQDQIQQPQTKNSHLKKKEHLTITRSQMTFSDYDVIIRQPQNFFFNFMNIVDKATRQYIKQIDESHRDLVCLLKKYFNMKLLLGLNQRYNSPHYTYINELRMMIFRYKEEKYMSKKFQDKFISDQFNDADLNRFIQLTQMLYKLTKQIKKPELMIFSAIISLLKKQFRNQTIEIVDSNSRIKPFKDKRVHQYFIYDRSQILFIYKNLSFETCNPLIAVIPFITQLWKSRKYQDSFIFQKLRPYLKTKR